MNSKKGTKKIAGHQLYISPIRLWIKLLLQNKISPKKLGTALRITFFVLTSAPLRWLQNMILIFRFPPADLSKTNPVFVIGHWRSGTTHLHQLLALDEQFSFLETFQALFFNIAFVSRLFMKPILRAFMPKTRLQDNVRISPESPEEEEQPFSNMSDKSSLHMYFFPKNISYFDKFCLFEGVTDQEKAAWKKDYSTLIRKISLYKGSEKPLLLKNPNNTARLKILLELFPNARFIFIHRDPYEVFASTTILYQKLISTQFLQDFSSEEIEQRILYCYEKLMKSYLDQRNLIPPDQLIEVVFDELISDPIGVLSNIYTHLQLGDFSGQIPKTKEHLKDLHDFKKNKLAKLRPEIIEQINHRWKFAFEEWGYRKREVIN